jgi:hypothetical protein
MDRAATARRVYMEHRATFFGVRPRRHSRWGLHETGKTTGYRGSAGSTWRPTPRAYIERVIGTIRRVCLDHLIVFNEATLGRHLKLFLAYYHETRTHLALKKEGAPASRLVQSPNMRRVVAGPRSRLHHRYVKSHNLEVGQGTGWLGPYRSAIVSSC